jgi:molybdopterin molybdotransferase
MTAPSPAIGLPVTEAQRLIRNAVTAIDSPESVDLRSALGRVLARDVIAPINVPAHDNSAMDGYALRGAELAAGGVLELKVVGLALAGKAWSGTVGAGESVRIMTGAVMPADCDTVIPQEFTLTSDAEKISLRADVVRAGENRRHAGEDLALGKVAVARGRVLRPAELGLLASLGVAEVAVQRRLRVAFFSTGDELCSPGEALTPGSVYDSNRFTIHGMLMRIGCEPLDLGVVADDPAALRAALLRAGELGADAIITSGGVSVGEADYIRQMMTQMGDVTFWKLLMRPGRPLAFGRIDVGGRQACLFGLPGNPVAAMVGFYFFVRDALLQMMGAQALPLQLMRASSAEALRKKPGRTEYQRGVLATDAQGAPTVRITGSQGAGILRSMSEANCIVVLGHEQGNVNAGDGVDVLLFDGLC